MSASPSLYHEVFDIFTNTISEGILVVDEKGDVIVANPRLLKIFGYTREQLEGKQFEILIPDLHREQHRGHFSHFLKDQSKRRMASGRTLYGKHREGHKVPVEVGLTPLKIDKSVFVVALIIDITHKYETERNIKKLNKELEAMVIDRTEQLNKTVDHLTRECEKRQLAETKVREALKREKELNAIKTSFMQMVSHEFKTPLSGILTSAMLIEKYSNSEQQDKRVKHLESIKRKVQHLDALLNDFLAVERLGSGRDSYRFTQFWLRDLIDEVIEESEQHLVNGQTLQKEVPAESIRMYQDRVVLNLIISNVLNNAIKYSGDTGKVKLQVERLNDQGLIKLQVSDNGMGIPLEEQQYIFSRYFRASNVKNIQGTGIGLNISKKHLQNLGGHIFFTSKEGEGTLFTIMLPEILQR